MQVGENYKPEHETVRYCTQLWTFAGLRGCSSGMTLQTPESSHATTLSTFRNAPRSPPVLLNLMGEALGLAGGPCSAPAVVLKALCILEELWAVLLRSPVKLLVGGKTEGPLAGLRNRQKIQFTEKDKNIWVIYPNIADTEILAPLQLQLTDSS